MEEIQMIAALIALAKAHPYVTGALLLWFALSTGWKSQPKEKRDEWSKAYPRPLGVLRFFLEILPDILGAGRVLVWQVIRGIASRESIASAPDSPIKGELRETIAPPLEEQAVQINDDGTPPARYVSRAHVENCGCAACSRSSAGYVEGAVLRVIGGVVLLALGIALLTGCPMPAPDGCSPGSRRCHEDTPQVCSPGQRWTPADVTCSTVNATCIVRDGVPACLRGEQ